MFFSLFADTEVTLAVALALGVSLSVLLLALEIDPIHPSQINPQIYVLCLQVVVVGLATDYCVGSSALHSLKEVGHVS